MSSLNEVVIEIQKKKRGRPKGSKNKPKISPIEVEENLKNSFSKTQSMRPQRKAAKRSSEMQFSIKPRSGGKCYYSTEITVDYTPQEVSAEKRVSIVPKLNVDNKPHIPGFIMDMDKTYYEKHDIRYFEEHKIKINDYSKPKDKLYQPKPGKRHNYCCVCKQSYEDYIEHVETNQHKKAYNQNDFSKLINDIHIEYDQFFRQNPKQDIGELYTDTQQENEEIIDSSTTQKCIMRKPMNEKQHYNHNHHNTQHHSASNLSAITNPFPTLVNQELYRRHACLTSMQEIPNPTHLHPLLSMKGQSSFNYLFDIPQMPLQNSHLASSQNCLGLNSKQTSSTGGSSTLQPTVYSSFNQAGGQNLYMNFSLPVGNENTNDLLMHQQQQQQQQQNQEQNILLNNSNNSFNNNNNNTNYMNNTNNNNINNNRNKYINAKSLNPLNCKRKGEPFSDNIECTHKQILYQTSILPPKIYDILDDVIPEQKQSSLQANVQAHLPTGQAFLRCPQTHCVI